MQTYYVALTESLKMILFYYFHTNNKMNAVFWAGRRYHHHPLSHWYPPKKGENFHGSKPDWQHDSDCKNCNKCHKRFKGKKHGGRRHCRGCGLVFCKYCTSSKISWSGTGIYKTYKSVRSMRTARNYQVRVCDNCYFELVVPV